MNIALLYSKLVGIMNEAPKSGYVSQSILDEYDFIIAEIRKEWPDIASSFEIKSQHRHDSGMRSEGIRCDARLLHTQGTGLMQYFSLMTQTEDKKIGFDPER